MPKVIFSFAGTGDDGKFDDQELEKQSFNDDVIRVYFKGCQKKNIGNGVVFPDLEIVASKIRAAFTADKLLDLDKLEAEFGDGIYVIKGRDNNQGKIDNIGLQGFSRGAVTCFSVAQKLDDLAIPMDIIANQPVPGEIFDSTPFSLYKKYHDLTKCKNIRSAVTLLVTHNLEKGFLHNNFFQQMVAKFPQETDAKNWLIPHHSHKDWLGREIIDWHIKMQFLKQGYTQQRPRYDSNFEARIKERYGDDLFEDFNRTLYFTPPEFSQKIFGTEEANISIDPLYTDMLIEEAKRILESISTVRPADFSITASQANAIITIYKLYREDSQLIDPGKELLELILKNDRQSKKFIEIVNKIDSVTTYLAQVIRDEKKGEDSSKNTKTTLIVNHSKVFKREIFEASFDYLTAGEKDLNTFVKRIDNAQREFEKQALDFNRSIIGKATKLIAEIVLVVTGVFSIIDPIFKVTTGEWLSFNETRSTCAMKQSLQEIKATACNQEAELDDLDALKLELEKYIKKHELQQSSKFWSRFSDISEHVELIAAKELIKLCGEEMDFERFSTEMLFALSNGELGEIVKKYNIPELREAQNMKCDDIIDLLDNPFCSPQKK
ncbi:Uncharacterised protein [Legionella beliardensis]|uniref:Uncharacterized protein n=1 Tax=Legionella beliardensis TaxID=91822 RepID=A0A378I1X2_9GAMM|nr:hypothetical protein [Legionella beliardensis]STX29187.1 Uncharacterised protein [Legionella beliardensis]